MQRVIFIIASILCGFLAESVLADVMHPWARPNVLIIMIVFFNLFRGIRYSLLAAVLAGILKDSFGVKTFGINIFAFVLCAYFTTFVKWYFYSVGSKASRVLMVFLVSVLNIFLHYFLYSMFAEVSFGQMIIYVFIPEMVWTVLITHYVFERLLKCAIRFSV